LRQVACFHGGGLSIHHAQALDMKDGGLRRKGKTFGNRIIGCAYFIIQQPCC